VHPKLLLADDSVTIQRVIELTFADEDVQVLAVGDGQQAIDRVKTDRPDIVLADVGMPERDGYEVAAFIKGDPELSHIPVLLLTGAFEPVDEARARAVGCDGVLVKPFEPQMVISRVRDLLAGKREGVSAGKAAHADAPPPPSGGAPAEPASSLEDYFDRLDAALASKGASAGTLDPPPGATPAAETGAKPGLTVVKPAPDARAPLADMDLTGWNPPAAAKAVESTTHEKRSVPPAPVPAPPPTPSAASPATPIAASPATPAASPATPSAASSATPSAASPATTVNAVNPPAALNPLSGVSLDQAFAALLAAEQGQAPSLTPRRLESAPREWPDAVPDAVIDAVVSKVIARMGDESMRSAVLDAAERLVREEIDRIKNAR
jgi:CheY-like chemotaxis protein